VISHGGAGAGGAAAVAPWRPAIPAKRRARIDRVRTSPPDHPVRDRRHGSQAHPRRRAAETAAQIHREVTRRPRRRLPTRNPIQIGAGAAGAEAEVAVRGLAVRPLQAVIRGVVRAGARPAADVREARKWPE
jgi:hypothetical protein